MRRECLDHLLVPREGHLRRVLREYAGSLNRDRPHQGPAPRIPEAASARVARGEQRGTVRATPIPSGLHHAVARTAERRTERLLGQNRRVTAMRGYRDPAPVLALQRP